jgi:hypothetical protein
VSGRKPALSADHEALTGATKPLEWLSAGTKRERKRVFPFLINRLILTVMPWRCGRRC